MPIHIENVYKKFSGFVALNNVNLDVESGELLALLGPSGSGKTTLLRIIAGLESPDKGVISFDGEETPTGDSGRHVGFVFQHYALFRHMTVFDNVAFGLNVRTRDKRLAKHEIRNKVFELLALVHLDAFHDRFPHELSGGQRQRVALARALAVEPKVLLLDEPFGALDAKVRKELRSWLRRLHDEIQLTSILVTHDQEEAMEVANRVVVMNQGGIEQVGSPEEVYHHPVNSFIYDFLGNYNAFDGWQDDSGNVHLIDFDVIAKPFKSPYNIQDKGLLSRYPELKKLGKKVIPNLFGDENDSSPKQSVKKEPIPTEGKPVKLFARPHEIFVNKTMDQGEYIEARVVHINPAGSLVKMELQRKNLQVIYAEVQKNVVDKLEIIKGDLIYIRPKNWRVFE
ncbi:MAG: sulfate ABC transporter ATP-binding protein [Alphaproteobacteria bacterium]|nr:sulfate ABC transporter ATP-binding protein [Alphaproteobacteria bacterium]